MADLVVYELFPRSSPMTARTGREWTGSEHALSTGCVHSLASSFVKSGRSKSPFAALSMLSNDRNTHVWLTSVESRAINSSLRYLLQAVGRVSWPPSFSEATTPLLVLVFAFFHIPNKALCHFAHKVGRKIYIAEKIAVLAEYTHLNLDYDLKEDLVIAIRIQRAPIE